MAGSTLGTIFTVSTFGESHGPGLGVIIDGCPAGMPLTEADIQAWLDRRRPGQSAYTTSRKEGDQVTILSGIFQGQTTGTPLAMLVPNESQRSQDYDALADVYRPGHGDLTYEAKYGIRDWRGGGRSSGRETIGRVAAGAVAAKLCSYLGISFRTYTRSIGEIEADCSKSCEPLPPFGMPDEAATKKAETYLNTLRAKGDSAGGVIECIIHGVPAGIGSPVFDKLDAALAKGILSIGAIKGIEFGEGFHAASLTGSQNNDSFLISQGNITKATNHGGGILAGISDGTDIVFRAAVKPTPSISLPQQTLNREGEEVTVEIKGRHDPIIVPRALVVVEAMAALTIADGLLVGMSSRLSDVQKIWNANSKKK